MSTRDLAVGTAAPVLERTITLTDMVAYAGATWDWHQMHYDLDYLAGKGFPAPVVDGQVFGALLAEQLQDWFGPRAVLRSLHFRFKSLVFAGETVRCTAVVTAIDPDLDGDGDGEIVALDCAVQVLRPDRSVDRTAVAPAGARMVLRR